MIVLGIVSLLAAVATVAAMIVWGVRHRFDPFDAFLLAIAGYVGCLIVAGFVMDATPLGLSRTGLAIPVLGAGAIAAGLLATVWRSSLPRPELPRGLDRRGRVRIAIGTVVVVAAGAALVSSLEFARRTEEHVLVQDSVAVYLDPSTGAVKIHNPTPTVQRLTVTSGFAVPTRTGDHQAGSSTTTVVLRPGQTWRAGTSARSGRFRLAVTPANGRAVTLTLTDREPDLDSGSIGSGW